MALRIVIIGAGITGLTTAITLNKYLPEPKPIITIVEIRHAPQTIGGAVNLTPKALRYLDHLGALGTLQEAGAGAECKKIEIFDLYSGSRFGEVDFKGQNGTGIGKDGSKKYFAMRTMRWQLQKALFRVPSQRTGYEILYGKKVVDIDESEKNVCVTFEDGEKIFGDTLLGCDGIHSCVRDLLIDRGRRPTYTGITTSMATSKVRDETQLRWNTTGVASSRRGSFMASFFETTRKHQYIAVVVETESVSDREGWKVRGSDQLAMKAQILERFYHQAMPKFKQLVEDAGEWTLYPVYKLPPSGNWTSPGARCILLGDAAHAMPPQGESTGICIEDAIVLARAMMHHETSSIPAIFRAYEGIRRPSVDVAYQIAVQRWENVRDKGWLAHQLMIMLTPWFLWWTSKSREDEFADGISGRSRRVMFGRCRVY